uniref:Addiction module toxin, HicA family n=1 Tax=Candidatus Methanogaster sp. ANME-2c ERB4 TaxID=2759911 RepID=A0A7G9YDJ4_9EURY|nr:hypothetical protein EBOGGPCF_00015 [Methanosarcinales archaeon ANME-2c ERB4]QNO46078.1 hypothetical protein FAKCHJAF_00015 [Methanosarcinales archaeon ANME-2c ERB4]QNO48847.1 hypothetical protein LEJCPHKL_00016 [Methanosarcinales archaeon ANME-2c ERB4]
MKGKLPRITAGKVTRVLEKVVFVLVRQSGSHRIYKNSEGNRVTVLYHSKKGSPPKDLKKHPQRCGLDGRTVQRTGGVDI